jgi:hypothetical protein
VLDFRDARTADKILEWAKLLEQIVQQRVVLIVIDTISRALCGGDENSPKDMGALVATVGRIQAGSGAHGSLVHHIPQDGNARLRGHGALLGALDTALHVAKGPSVRTATVTKANDSEEGEKVTFSLESVELSRDADGNVTTAPVVVPAAPGEAAPAKTKAPTTAKGTQSGFRSLVYALNEVGQVAAVSNHIPANTKVVTIDQWREYAYRSGISAGDSRARQKAFATAFEKLVGGGKIAVWDPHVWVVQ